MGIHRKALAIGAGAVVFASMSGYGIALARDAGSPPRAPGAASTRSHPDIAETMREGCRGHGPVMSDREMRAMHREVMRRPETRRWHDDMMGDGGMPGM
jgi:hypothetical protein